MIDLLRECLNYRGMKYIEYFYSAHSAFAYIGARRLMEICTANGCKLKHRPMALSPVIEAAGGLPFSSRTRGHRDYFFGREIERWAELRNVPIINYRPIYHDNPLELANGMLIAAIDLGEDVDKLSHAILEAHWRDDADIADAATLAEVARSIGMEPAKPLEAAKSAPIQEKHKANTQEAISRSVFGSPTYFLDGDMFYGQDRLEILERALTQPFAATNWRNP